MEPIESSETSAYINTLTPGTYPKEKKLQSKHGESLKSRTYILSLYAKSVERELRVETYTCEIAVMNFSVLQSVVLFVSEA